MSDIAIRFDGIILAATLAAGASIYIAVALAAALLTRSRRGLGRSRSLLRTAGTFALLHIAGLAAAVTYMDRVGPPQSGPDRLDWLAVPTLLIFASGWMVIARRKSGAPD